MIEEICDLLDEAYGRPVCSPGYAPLEELILTILSQHTAAVNYRRAFAGLRERFPSWEEALSAETGEIEEAIRIGGLAKIKAVRIKRLLADVRSRYGALSLDFLAEMPDEEARSLLMQFDGVGLKTASCVLMFSLGRPVLPVDTHVHRISKRLGLIGPGVSAEEAHHLLQKQVPDRLVYAFHVNLVTHGRQTCRAQRPACDVCPLLAICPSGPAQLATGGF